MVTPQLDCTFWYLLRWQRLSSHGSSLCQSCLCHDFWRSPARPVLACYHLQPDCSIFLSNSRDLQLTKYFWILLQSKWNSVRPSFPLSSFWRVLRCSQKQVSVHWNGSSNCIILTYAEDTSSRLTMRWPVSLLKPSVLMSHPRMCLERLKIITLSWKTASYLRVPSTHSWRQCCLEFWLIQRPIPPCPVWKMWKVMFDLQLPGLTGNSCFIPHIASNLLEDAFEIWIDITLRNRLLRDREREIWTMASEIAEKMKYVTPVYHTSSIWASMSSSSGLKKKCTWESSQTSGNAQLEQNLFVCGWKRVRPRTLPTSCTSLLCHSYLVWACFSENTLRMKRPFLWGWKVEGMTAYSPGGSLKRSHTSRVLMKVLLMATARCRSRTSGPRWTLLRPWSWGRPGKVLKGEPESTFIAFYHMIKNNSNTLDSEADYSVTHGGDCWSGECNTYLLWHLQTENRQFFIYFFKKENFLKIFIQKNLNWSVTLFGDTL